MIACGWDKGPMTAAHTFCIRNPVVAATTKALAVAPQELCVIFSQRCCRSSIQ